MTVPKFIPICPIFHITIHFSSLYPCQKPLSFLETSVFTYSSCKSYRLYLTHYSDSNRVEHVQCFLWYEISHAHIHLMHLHAQFTHPPQHSHTTPTHSFTNTHTHILTNSTHIHTAHPTFTHLQTHAHMLRHSHTSLSFT